MGNICYWVTTLFLLNLVSFSEFALANPKKALQLLNRDGTYAQPVTDSPCNNPYAQTEEECEAVESWTPDAFTHVNSLTTEKKFRLLIHGITGFEAIDPESNRLWRDILLEDPSRLTGNPKISASIISESHPYTFCARIAFILEVMPENVVASNGSDCGSPRLNGYNSDSEKQLCDFSKIPPWTEIRTPEKIYELSEKRNSYSEVVIRGLGYKTGSPVKITGVILKCSVKKLTRIDSLNDQDFTEFVKSKCSISEYLGNLGSILKLRNQLPFFALALQ